MRRTDDEKDLPRISPIHFTNENSSLKLELETQSHMGMLEFDDDWKIVGWALAQDVAPREMCLYVILCERDGFRVWCHATDCIIEIIAEKVREDPSRIAPLR